MEELILTRDFSVITSSCFFHGIFNAKVQLFTLKMKQLITLYGCFNCPIKKVIYEFVFQNVELMSYISFTIAYLFCIEFIELCFVSMFSPKTQNFGLGAISHIDKFFVPPSVTYGTGYTT